MCVCVCTFLCVQVQYGEVRGQLGESLSFASTMSGLGMDLRLLAPEPWCPVTPLPRPPFLSISPIPCLWRLRVSAVTNILLFLACPPCGCPTCGPLLHSELGREMENSQLPL